VTNPPGSFLTDTTNLLQWWKDTGIGNTGWNLQPTNKGTPLISLARTTALSATTIYTPGATATFQILADAVCTTSSAAATVTLTVTYTDSSGTAQTIAPSAASCNALGASSFARINEYIEAKASTNIQVAASIANTPTFNVRASALQITSQ
jgi:hypothetical protein